MEKKKTEVLTQEEIDELLTAISPADADTDEYFRPASFNIEDFEKYLTERQWTPEEPYGIFDKDISICRLFDSGGDETILEEIKRKNESQGYGNIKIPNTNITLINYSFCPKCKTIFSFKEVTDYYTHPKPDNQYTNIQQQYRKDTRVYCHNCNSYFISLIQTKTSAPSEFCCNSERIYRLGGRRRIQLSFLSTRQHSRRNSS